MLYANNCNHYYMCYNVLPLQLLVKHYLWKFHIDNIIAISNNICITIIKLSAKKDMFNRHVHISVDKSNYFDIFSCIFAICFMYIPPTYYRARYLFRLLDYG